MKKTLSILALLIASFGVTAGGPQGDIEACLDSCFDNCQSYADRLQSLDRTLYIATCRSNCIMLCYNAWIASNED